MRLPVVFGLLSVMAVFTAPAFGQSFVGEWTATAHVQGGDTSEIVAVAKVGEVYSITSKLVVDAPPGAPQAGPGTDIVIDKDHFSYKRTITTPGGSLVITYTGVVSGDTFTGTADLGGMGSVPYTGVRIKHSG